MYWGFSSFSHFALPGSSHWIALSLHAVPGTAIAWRCRSSVIFDFGLLVGVSTAQLVHLVSAPTSLRAAQRTLCRRSVIDRTYSDPSDLVVVLLVFVLYMHLSFMVVNPGPPDATHTSLCVWPCLGVSFTYKRLFCVSLSLACALSVWAVKHTI